MANWFITRDGKEHGPYSSGQLKQFAAAGQIQADTPVRREDHQAPSPAGSFKGLLPGQQTPQPQLAAPPSPSAPPPITAQAVGPSGSTLGLKAREMLKNPLWIIVGILVAGFVLFSCCGGICLLGAFGPGLPGRFESEDQFRSLVMHKTPDEVIAAVGKPSHVFPSGRFTNSEHYDEVWEYAGAVSHKATGQSQTVQAFFRNGHVIETGVK